MNSNLHDRERAAGLSTAESRDELMRRVHERLLLDLDMDRLDRMPADEARRSVEQAITLVLAEVAPGLAGLGKQEAIRAVLDEVIGFGPLQPLLEDPDITEVMVNGPSEIYFERGNTDFMAFLNQLKAARPDIVLYVGTASEGAMILKQAQEIGITPGIKFIGSEEMGEMELVSLAGAEAADGS